MSELHSWLSEHTNAQDMRPHCVQFFTSATSVQGQKRRFRDVGCESALPPRTDIVSAELQGSSRDQLYPPMTGIAPSPFRPHRRLT
jgi:hypothetical protein